MSGLPQTHLELNTPLCITECVEFKMLVAVFVRKISRFRFIPCMAAGLAYQLSTKMPGVDPNRIMMLKGDYEQQWQLAADEDREKAPVRFVPRNSFYYS